MIAAATQSAYRFVKVMSDAPEWRIFSVATGAFLCTARDQQLCEAIDRIGREPAPEREGQHAAVPVRG